jgi:hypothetical protein
MIPPTATRIDLSQTPSGAEPATTATLASYLRGRAHYCTQLSRGCSDQAIARALEAMAMDFLEKASELDALTYIPPMRDPGGP